MPDTARLTIALGDRYRIEREIGAGGMATVYLARDLKHDRDVALKVLRPELGAVLGSDRFLSEIRISAGLDHPHILTLIDSGESDGLLWYVLPYVRGESLRAMLEREKQLSLEQALAITRQIAGALDYAHQHGVVHRDIKPENILLHEGEAMLADFGIALAVKEAGGNRLTETGLSLGTPQYMSPEQATGDRTLDARSDVYSLGAVLYEMLAGEPPVTGATAQVMIAKLMTERPTRLRIVRDTVPEGVDAAVAKALAKVPADRFARASDFQAALGAAGQRVDGARPRPRWLVPAVVAAVAAFAAVLATSMRRGGGVVAPVQLDRVQLTFTGNARNPALSADGRRVAYGVRQCPADGRCTVDIVIQDVGGAGAATIVRGLGAMWDIEWTADGRYLFFGGSYGSGRWGAFSVPTLGGSAPRFLGCCDGNLIAGSDSAYVTGTPGGKPEVMARLVTIADGIVRDSLRIPVSPVSAAFLSVFPDRQRLATFVQAPASLTIRVGDRAGAVTDSLVFRGANVPSAELSPDGQSLLLSHSRPQSSEDDIVRHPVSAQGRIGQRGDTLLRQLQVSAGMQLGASGQLVLSAGPTEYALWGMRRRAPADVVFPVQRRLAVGTANISGSISHSGDRVLIMRTVATGTQRVRQLSIIPFDSGPEIPLAVPFQHLVDWDWGVDERSVMIAERRGDSVVASELDVATGRARARATVPLGEFQTLEALSGGAFVVFSPAGVILRRYGMAGLPDTVLQLPAAGHPENGDQSPDGRSLATIGWDADYDSIIVQRISLADGALTRLASFSGEGYDGMRWLPDGTLQFGVMESVGSTSWYRMPAAGGRPVRLGTPPRSPATYRLSADGLRVLGRVADLKPDVYLIRNFGELLNR